jgi:hypothetical protein
MVGSILSAVARQLCFMAWRKARQTPEKVASKIDALPASPISATQFLFLSILKQTFSTSDESQRKSDGLVNP